MKKALTAGITGRDGSYLSERHYIPLALHLCHSLGFYHTTSD